MIKSGTFCLIQRSVAGGIGRWTRLWEVNYRAVTPIQKIRARVIERSAITELVARRHRNHVLKSALTGQASSY